MTLTRDDIVGELSELRFFQIAQRTWPRTPYWFLGIERADPEWDVRGIDAFARILRKDEEGAVLVPVQVKSSAKAVKKYRARHPGLVKHTAMVLVNSGRSDEAIAQIFYASLRRLRDQSVSTDEFLEWLGNRPLSERAERNLELIAQRRAALFAG